MKPKNSSTLARSFISLSLAASTLVGGLATSRAGAQSADGATRTNQQTSSSRDESQYPLLARYASDLTRSARLGKLERAAGHDADVQKAIEILSLDAKNNPVLLADEGEGAAAAVARGVAQRVAANRVPSRLRGARVFSLDRDALVAGTKTNDEFVARLQSVLSETATARGRVVLFAEGFHHLLGSYTSREASDAVRASIERGDLQVIGATTRAIYDEHIGKNDALAKLLQPVELTDGAARPDRDDETAGVIMSGDNKLSPDLRQLTEGARSTDRVGVILQTADLNDPKLASLFSRYGVEINSRMAQLGTMRVEVPAGALKELAASGATRYLSPDRDVRSLGHVTLTTGTDAVRSGGLLSGLFGTTLDGSGVGIAVIDSGIDVAHRAFEGRIKFRKDFTVENKSDKDYYGHGTHVAAAAAGVDPDDEYERTYEGIARNANIINLRVLNSQGTGKSSDLLNALNWILTPVDPNRPLSTSNKTNAAYYNIRVVNMSLGAPAVDSYRNDPLCKAVRKLVDAGIVVVAAAGNNGKDATGKKVYGLIHSPGNEPSAITVGASNTMGSSARNDDVITTYSSRGPTRGFSTDAEGVKHYDNLIKPDLVAPGNKLIYAEADDGKDRPNKLVADNPSLDARINKDDNKKLMYLSGTSMATPIVAGAAALLLQAKPSLTPNMVKMILMYTAQPLPGFNMLEQGAGQLNVEGAMRLAKLVRNDLTNSTPQGSAFLSTSNLPTPSTTIAGYAFPWSQGILLKQHYATGTNLIAKYQTVYGTGILLSDGILMSDDVLTSDGILMSDRILMGDGILMGDSILVSDGTVLGSGTPFIPCGHLMSDGILMSDGHLMSDGILMSDGHLMSDGILMSDAALEAMSAAVNGDDTPAMN
jgi:subtilisin family serine protease